MRRLNEFPYKHVLVLGLAKSGTKAAEVLLNSNIDVRINDKNAKDTDENVVSLRKKGAEVIVGSHPETVLDGIDLIVKNPGIPYEHRLVELALERGIPVITEVELAYQLAKENPLIGITGSNGKTTTTMLVYEMLKHSGKPVKLAGNIGIAATEVAEQLESGERLLLELSSFQLLGTENFRPKIACILNLHEAHLDYHGTIEAYEAAKAKIFINQTEDDYFVYNADDERLEKWLALVRAKLVPFSATKVLPFGAWTNGEALFFKGEKIIELDDVLLVGEHNVENMLAAIAIAKLSGATNEGIKHTLRTFSGVKHRLQFVADINGRLFYNDSKATNTLATKKALSSFDTPTILLAGGLDRGEDLTTLIPYMKNVKACIFFGETKEKFQRVAEMAGIDDIHLVQDVVDAVKLAYELSAEGDTILLSPACASWDQYKTFEERGDMFIQTVHTLT